ncbi:MAG: hypothetical protein FJ387_24075 [Verrucomicrobia bacterium]|nr:hypothetical protein [Verrucomicrobiota bacterium]
MAIEIILVLLITAGAVYLFVTEKFRADLVALMVLGALVLVGLFQHLVSWIRPERWITPEEGISGFSNPATITVAAMFVLSAGLQKTGAVAWAARLLKPLVAFPTLLLLAMMLTVGVVSAFINNTAAVAVFMPLALAACAGGKVSASKLLIPLSFASQFGGVCTLIGTSTNLLVSSISERAGRGAFSMFEFAPLGVVLLGAGTLYLLLFNFQSCRPREPLLPPRMCHQSQLPSTHPRQRRGVLPLLESQPARGAGQSRATPARRRETTTARSLSLFRSLAIFRFKRQVQNPDGKKSLPDFERHVQRKPGGLIRRFTQRRHEEQGLWPRPAGRRSNPGFCRSSPRPC